MRGKLILALACIAGPGSSAMADETVGPEPLLTPLNVAMKQGGPASLQPPGITEGRLGYLRRSRCVNANGCTVRVPRFDVAERDYIRSLTLVSYGSMDVKFTGDRVKLKVRF